MKKDAVLFLFAGMVFGSVVTFVAMKGAEKAPARIPSENAAGNESSDTGASGMNKEEHSSMMREYIKKAKAAPDDLQARVTLGNIYYDMGKFKEAAEWYEEASKLDPKNTDVIVDLGVCYRQTEPKKSIELFDRALSVDPKKREALINKVVVYLYDLKDVAAAKRSLAEFQEACPDDPEVKQLADEITETGKGT